MTQCNYLVVIYEVGKPTDWQHCKKKWVTYTDFKRLVDEIHDWFIYDGDRYWIGERRSFQMEGVMKPTMVIILDTKKEVKNVEKA